MKIVTEMKNTLNRLISILALASLACCSIMPLQDADSDDPQSQDFHSIIIDHRAIADFENLTTEQIQNAKKVLLIISGESHARAYGYGLELLEDDNPVYDAETNWSEAPDPYTDQHLRWSRAWRGDDYSSWVTSLGEEDFFTNSAGRTTVENALLEIDSNYTGTIMFGFGWCWDMTRGNPPIGEDPIYGCGWAGSSVGSPGVDPTDYPYGLPWGIDDADNTITGNSVNLQTYLDAVDAYNALDTKVITIFTTGPVDGNQSNESGYQRWLKHEAIRDYVHVNGGVLFDWSDLLSYDYSSESRIIESWNGNDWYGINPSFDAVYNGGEGDCHISADACRIIGKALWVMAARVYELTFKGRLRHICIF